MNTSTENIHSYSQVISKPFTIAQICHITDLIGSFLKEASDTI
jgi:hypothetical protein